MWYKVTSPNYEDFVHQAKVTVVPKGLTDEMVQPGEDAFFFDGDAKKPAVDVQHFVDDKDIRTENFIGVATKSLYKDIPFEIVGTGPAVDYTLTTPEPVPYKWLDACLAEFGGGKTGEEGYEAAGNAKGKNGVALWESYVAGLDPTDPTSQFRAFIRMGADGKPVLAWQPDQRDANPPRTYVEYGKANLGDADWTPVTDANRATMRFFKVGVKLAEWSRLSGWAWCGTILAITPNSVIAGV